MVRGKANTDEAKITGITPAWLILSGRCVACPPYIRRPTTLLAYWTGIFLCPSVTITTRTTTARAITRNARKPRGLIPPLPRAPMVPMVEGSKRETIPAKISKEIPLPIPRSEMTSPSHISKILPPVITAITVTTAQGLPGSVMASRKPIVRAVACKRPRITVPYRVYWAITFRPSTPSLASSSRRGMTMVKRFIIIEAVI